MGPTTVSFNATPEAWEGIQIMLHRNMTFVAGGTALIGALAPFAAADQLATRQELRDFLKVVMARPAESVEMRFRATLRHRPPNRDELEKDLRAAWGDHANPGGPLEAQFQAEVDRQFALSSKPRRMEGSVRWNNPPRVDRDVDYVRESTGYSGDETVPLFEPTRFVSIEAAGELVAVHRHEFLNSKIFVDENREHNLWIADWASVPWALRVTFEVYFSVAKVAVPDDRVPSEAMIDTLAQAKTMQITVARDVPATEDAEKKVDRWTVSRPILDKPDWVIETPPGDLTRFARVEGSTRWLGGAPSIKRVEAWRSDGWPERFSMAAYSSPDVTNFSIAVVVEELKVGRQPIDFSTFRTPPEGFLDFRDPKAQFQQPR